MNGATRGLSEVNHAFSRWIDVFKKSGFGKSSMKRSTRQVLLFSGLAISFLSVAGGISYVVLKNMGEQ